MRLPAYTKHTQRSRAATCTGDYCTDVAAHAPEDRLEGESLDFRRKARVSRRAGVIDGRLLSIRLRSEEDECRFYLILERSPDRMV